MYTYAQIVRATMLAPRPYQHFDILASTGPFTAIGLLAGQLRSQLSRTHMNAVTRELEAVWLHATADRSRRWADDVKKSICSGSTVVVASRCIRAGWTSPRDAAS